MCVCVVLCYLKMTQPADEKKDTQPVNQAWVTLVMMSDSYVIGALVLAQSLREVRTIYELVCMVTNAVSREAKVALSKVYDHVFEVPNIKKASRPLPGRKQQERYGEEFLSLAFTKWNCLNLVQYETVCFIDADIVFSKNPDTLFQLKAPAGSFVNPWRQSDPWYSWPLHGDPVPASRIRVALSEKTGFVVFGSMVLLAPDRRIYAEMIRHLEQVERYGDNFLTTSGPDELLITELYVRRDVDWTQIGPHFQAIAWKDYGPKIGIIPVHQIIGYHYHGKEKPWQMRPMQWPDLRCWWDAMDCLRVVARQKGWDIVMKFLIADLV